MFRFLDFKKYSAILDETKKEKKMNSDQATKKIEELKEQNLKLKSKLDRIQELVNQALVKSPKS